MSGRIIREGQQKADHPDRDAAVSRSRHAGKANTRESSHLVGKDLMRLSRFYRTDSNET